MGTERPERVYGVARVAYVGAVLRLRRTTTTWVDLRVPLEPHSTSAPLPGWTKEQYDATVAMAQAWVDLVRRRKEYTSARRAMREDGWR